MSRYPSRSLVLLACLLFAQSCYSQAQQSKDTTPPATKLEAFSAKTGVVIIRGFTTVGTLPGLGSVSIDAREFRDAATKSKVTGLSFEVKESGRFEKENTSFVDYDEIDSLIQGIDYISRINSSVTPMKSF